MSDDNKVSVGERKRPEGTWERDPRTLRLTFRRNRDETSGVAPAVGLDWVQGPAVSPQGVEVTLREPLQITGVPAPCQGPVTPVHPTRQVTLPVWLGSLPAVQDCWGRILPAVPRRALTTVCLSLPHLVGCKLCQFLIFHKFF